MRLIYNGIDLMVQETVRYDMEPVYDDTGTDYLYTRHLFVGRALVNGEAAVFFGRQTPQGFLRSGPMMTYVRSGGSILYASLDNPSGARNLRVGDMQIPRPAWNSNQVGFMPKGTGMDAAPQSLLAEVVPFPTSTLTTMESIRQRLMMPRGPLVILSGGWGPDPATLQQPYQVLLATPLPGMRTDCKNGPSPRLLSIVQALGDANTLVVEFAVEAFVNEAAQDGVRNPGALLSNRYSQNQIVQEDGSTVIQTRGQAIFRTDALYALMESPDSRRSILVLPIPIGFIRGNIQVQGMADVTGVEYAFEDRQVPVNFAAAPFVKGAKINALHRQALIAGKDILEGALTAYERTIGTIANRKFATQDYENGGKPKHPPESVNQRHEQLN